VGKGVNVSGRSRVGGQWGGEGKVPFLKTLQF